MKLIYKYIIHTTIYLLLFIIMFQLVIYSDKINTIVNVGLIEKYVSDENLNMPFPNYIQLPNNDANILKLMNKDIYKFHESVKNNYYYDELYDCKYWTYVWTNYWKFHKDEYDLQVIRTNEHIFAILSNENIYCVADQVNLNCIETIK